MEVKFRCTTISHTTDEILLQSSSPAPDRGIGGPRSLERLRQELRQFQRKSTVMAAALLVTDATAYIACFLCLVLLRCS
jgi:hypothetical protein